LDCLLHFRLVCDAEHACVVGMVPLAAELGATVTAPCGLVHSGAGPAPHLERTAAPH
jgi:hypothetical protein